MQLQGRRKQERKGKGEARTDLLKETAKAPEAKDQKVPVHPEKETTQLATSSCRESARILLVIIGVLLSAPNTEQKKGGNSAKSVPFMHTEDKKVNERSRCRTQHQTKHQSPW